MPEIERLVNRDHDEAGAGNASSHDQRKSRFRTIYGSFFRLFRFRLMDLMWLSAMTAVLILWYKDHQSLSDRIVSVNVRSSWSVKQVLGRPDTPIAGDHGSAWASAGQDTGTEWVIVEFPRAVPTSKLQIEETYNPGAVNRICTVSWRGIETEVWKGKDPVNPVSGKGTSVIALPRDVSARRFKIYLDSASVAGWNEIDAVALQGQDGSIQWASNAWASSCFGSNQTVPNLYWP